MKILLVFVVTCAVVSASTCVKLSVGNAATSNESLCNPSSVAPAAPVKCTTPTLELPTVPTIKCTVPTINTPPTTDISKCAPTPVKCDPTPICKTPVPPLPTPTPSQPYCPKEPGGPSSATPEPTSYALIGLGLAAAGLWRRARRQEVQLTDEGVD